MWHDGKAASRSNAFFHSRHASRTGDALRRPVMACLVWVSLFVFGLTATPVPARVWTDASGEHTVQAEFVTVQFDKVWLRRVDGKIFGVDATTLSEPDQHHINAIMADRKAHVKKTDNPAGRIAYGVGYMRGRLQCDAIEESSGIACSRRHAGFFWTHNDSGDDARIYLVDATGRDVGRGQLKDVFAFDWEDCFSFQRDGESFLVFCDTGNNGHSAPIQVLYVIKEPEFDAKDGLAETTIPVVQTIYYAYEDDYRDCEAVAIDPTNRTLLFVAREREAQCNVYALKWPEVASDTALVAKQIGSMPLAYVTAMDVSPDGCRAIVLTYQDAYEFVRKENQTWTKAFQSKPRRIVMPERIQGESICYGADGKTLYLTSEKRPTPLFEVPILPDKATAR